MAQLYFIKVTSIDLLYTMFALCYISIMLATCNFNVIFALDFFCSGFN